MKLTKIEKIIFISLAALIVTALLAFFAVRVAFRAPAANSYKISEKAFPIPGLDQGFIPQGICYAPSSEDFLITGYMQDGSASPIYVVEQATGKTKKVVYVKLDDMGKNQYKGHAGGIATHGRYVYLADGGGHQIFVLDLSLIYLTSDGKNVPILGSVKLESSDGDSVTPSFLTATDTMLFVGEFYREGNYEKPESHHVTTGTGEDHHALLVGFPFVDGAENILGVDATPAAAISLPERIQGAVISDGKVYLSQSYGASTSHLYVYDQEKLDNAGSIGVLETNVPLMHLDSASLIHDEKLPPMAEEIEIVDGKLYTMCESASNKYFFGKIIDADWCYATILEKLLK